MEFIPYCHMDSCHLYGRQIYDNWYYGPMISSKNRKMLMPKDTGNFDTNEYLIKVASIACGGCQKLNNLDGKCNVQTTINNENETLVMYE